MSKASVTRIFTGSVLALAFGIVFSMVAALAMFAGGGFVTNGTDVTGVQSTPFAGAMILGFVVCGLSIVAGGLGLLVAWIGAVVNTAALPDKTWFVLLLVLGLLSFGFIATLIYVVAGPDGSKVGGQPRLPAAGAPA